MRALWCLVAGAALAPSLCAMAAPTAWTSWTATSGSPINGVSGSIAAAAGTVAVEYTGEVYFAQINNTGTNFYSPSMPFLSPLVPNAPPRCDIIALQGGSGTGLHTLKFNPPVDNPVMAIVSLGQWGITVTYDFDVPFTILSYGPGYWGFPGTLNNVGGQKLTGNEGHGTIRFIGRVHEIHWTIPVAETWHGFTVGVPGNVPCACDLNGDGLVDDTDFVGFIAAYNILDCLDASMPARCPADFNGDNVVDDVDFMIFVAAYNELFCSQ